MIGLGGDIDFEKYLAKHEKNKLGEHVRPASEFMEGALKRLAIGVDVFGDPMPFIKTQSMFRFRPAELTIWAGVNGNGKALSLETMIATPDGFVRLRDIHAGSVVFDENGNQCNVVAETPVQMNRECYKVVFSDGSVIIADGEHEWLTKTAKCRASYRVAKKNNRVTERELSKFGSDQSSKRTYPAIVTTKEIASTVKVGDGCRKGLTEHSVSVAGALSIKDKQLPIDPYILGLWLGDGDSNNSGITTADIEIFDTFADSGYEVVKLTGKYKYGVRGGLFRALRLAGLLNNKHIPSDYLWASERQRLALLQGLMDSDGYADKNAGQSEFCNTNKLLASGTLLLVQSLGIKATMKVGDSVLDGVVHGNKYRVMFTTKKPVFRLERKIARLISKGSDILHERFIIECKPCKSVPVKCIQVDSDSHLFLAGESLIPTHNSLVMGMCALWLAKYTGVCIASMEMPPESTMARMLNQVSGVDKPNQKTVDDLLAVVDGKMFIYDRVGTVSREAIYGAIHYAAKEKNVKHFMIDSLVKCGLGTDDYNGQKKFVDKLANISREHNIHIHLVVHIRKLDNDRSMPSKADIKGAGEITDLADNVIIVARNIQKENDVSKGVVVKNYVPDGYIRVAKQRHGEWDGIWGFWWHSESQQWLEENTAWCKNYF